MQSGSMENGFANSRATLCEHGLCMCCNILLGQLGAAITPGTHQLHVRSSMEIVLFLFFMAIAKLFVHNGDIIEVCSHPGIFEPIWRKGFWSSNVAASGTTI